MSSAAHQIAAELEYSIIKGISLEWEVAFNLLDKAYRPLWRKPFFSIRDLTGRLGYWSHDRYEICLSRDLVLNHSWDSVVDVLRHEMAHQFVTIFYGLGQETAHGPIFQRACQMLRANAEASDHYRPLDERYVMESDSAQDKLALKVKKLLALAESQNQHEAEAAMLKAHELITRHQLDLLQHQTERNYFSIYLGRPRLRHFRDEYDLADLILSFYFVEGLWISTYITEKGKMGRVLEISGTSRNLQMAEYVYHFIQNYIESQWRVYKAGRKLDRRRQTDFAVGIIEGFRAKLEAGVNQGKMDAREKALVKSGDSKLKNYCKRRYPRIVSFWRVIPGRDEGVYQDGVEIGKKLVISKGVTQQGPAGKLLA